MVLKPGGEADPESMEVSYRICSTFKKPGLDLEGGKKKKGIGVCGPRKLKFQKQPSQAELGKWELSGATTNCLSVPCHLHLEHRC